MRYSEQSHSDQTMCQAGIEPMLSTKHLPLLYDIQDSQLCKDNAALVERMAAECARDHKVLRMERQYAASRLTQVHPAQSTCSRRQRFHAHFALISMLAGWLIAWLPIQMHVAALHLGSVWSCDEKTFHCNESSLAQQRGKNPAQLVSKERP